MPSEEKEWKVWARFSGHVKSTVELGQYKERKKWNTIRL
jgi:hypothetical protein